MGEVAHIRRTGSLILIKRSGSDRECNPERTPNGREHPCFLACTVGVKLSDLIADETERVSAIEDARSGHKKGRQASAMLYGKLLAEFCYGEAGSALESMKDVFGTSIASAKAA